MRFASAFVTILIISFTHGTRGDSSNASDSHRSTFNVALLQMRPSGDDLEANRRKADAFCRQAAQAGADVALMPELWSTGYTRFDPEKPGSREAFLDKAIDKEHPFVQHFSSLAKKLQMAIAVTYMQNWPTVATGPRNAMTLFDRQGNEVWTYAKVHTSDMKSLECAMTPGTEFFVGPLDTSKGTVQVGGMICFDREFPESARLLMLRGAEIILTPNSCTLDDRRLAQFMVRGMENAVGVAMTNYPAPKNNGRSVAYDERSNGLVEAGPNEGVYLAKFDLQKLRETRQKSIWGAAYRRPHRYAELTNPGRQPNWDRANGLGVPFVPTER